MYNRVFSSGIALFFADYLTKNPKIIEILKIAGVFVFFALAVFFFLLSRKKVASTPLVIIKIIL